MHDDHFHNKAARRSKAPLSSSLLALVCLLAALAPLGAAQPKLQTGTKPTGTGMLTPSAVLQRAKSTTQTVPQAGVPTAPVQVALLGPSKLQMGTFYNQYNAASCLEADVACGFGATVMRLMTGGVMPNRELRYDVWETNETMFARIYLQLRAGRTKSATYEIKLTYLPGDNETFTVDEGGTLSVKTRMAEGGNAFTSDSNYRVLASQSYAAKQGMANRDEQVITFRQTIGPSFWTSNASAWADFDVFADPTSQTMSGKVVSIELLRVGD